MKKLLTTIAGLVAVAPVLITRASAQSNVSCGNSILPGGLCNLVSGFDFSISGILKYIFTIIIFILVLFIVFQIIKAVFDWVGKSNDDKARQGAIKSITNAVLAGVILIIAIVALIIVTNVIGVKATNPLYACYKNASDQAAGVELKDAIAAEGTSTTGKNVSSDPDLKSKYVCLDTNTNNEVTNTSYIVAKRVTVTKATESPR